MRPELPHVGAIDRVLALRSLSLFDGLRTRDLTAIAHLMHDEEVEAGQVLQAEGRPCDRLWVVPEGRLRWLAGGTVVDEEQAPGFVGLNAALGGSGATLECRAATDGAAMWMDAGAFLDVLEDHFELFLHVRRWLAERVVGLQAEVGSFHTVAEATSVEPWPEPPMAIVDRLLAMRRTPVFRDIPVNAVAQMARGDRDFTCESGSELWCRGDAGAFLVVVTRGEVECRCPDGGVGFRAGPGFVLGADAALGGVAYGYDATAATEVGGIRIEASMLIDVIEDHPAVARWILAHFAREEVRLRKQRAGVATA